MPTQRGLSYEDAVELYKAGFRQPENMRMGDLGEEHRLEPTFRLYEPSLSELIAACGFPFYLSANAEGFWYAKNAVHSEAIRADGKTPEAAVKNLWLKLNAK